MTDGPSKDSALYGLKVVEFAHAIAGPMAGTLLADLGAEVVHVESPSGDEFRHNGMKKDGIPLWWKVGARNKRSVVVDLRSPEGHEVARQLTAWADVVITNLRAETLDRWGLSYDHLHEMNPRVIVLNVSGYGSNTSRRDEPGFGKLGEARSGAVHITGFPDGPPLHPGFSWADSVTPVMGAFGILAALHRRAADPSFDGELIDLAIFETLYRLVDWQIPVVDQLGEAVSRQGNRLAVAPGAVVNTYQTAEGDWITVTSATKKSVLNVVRLLGLPEGEYQTVGDQNARSDVLDDALRGWVGSRSTAECLSEMAEREVVASPIFGIKEIFADQTYAERDDIVAVDDPDLGSVRMQAVIPKLRRHAGAIWRTGPALGADGDDYLDRILAAPAAADPDPGPDVDPAGRAPRDGEQGSFAGLRVVELAHVIAGPLAGTLLADHGADVVHVEPPGGEDGRWLGPHKDGTYLWWKSLGRNKRSVGLDLRTEAGQAVARRLVGWADVVITSIRIDTLERWGLSFEQVRAINPKVVYLQITGFGTDTSLRSAPGFGKVGEARSGVVALTGEAGGPPVHVGFSHGDAMTGLMAAMGVGAALYRRDRDPAFEGEWIDLALFETLFRLIEPQVIYYDQLGYEIPRSGNALPIAPQGVIDAFQTKDGEWITVSAGTAKAVLSIARLLGIPEEELQSRDEQRRRAPELAGRLGEWIGARVASEVTGSLREHGIVASPIMSAADILEDETYRERGDVVTVDDVDLGSIRMAAALPHLRNHPGRVRWTGPGVAEHTDVVLREELHLADEEMARLRADGAFGPA